MSRYHKKVYMPDNVKGNLKGFNDGLNFLRWQYTSHCIDNLRHRSYDIRGILEFISKLKLNYDDIFELYTDDKDNITKACYRIKYDIVDLILVITADKKIITIYTNIKDDDHITLDKNIYNRG